MAPAKAAMTRPAVASGRMPKVPEAASSSVVSVEKIVLAERKYDLDTEILKCPICSEPFSPPVYQCQSGHTACSACHVKISKCPSCSQPIGT